VNPKTVEFQIGRTLVGLILASTREIQPDETSAVETVGAKVEGKKKYQSKAEDFKVAIKPSPCGDRRAC